ncbi:MAG: hypothetical protein R8G01_13380 [Ilumatobacteraceae bacterium]|nr:hypothetical protein [Ilumatobacteraceae bacterium]
MGNEIELISDGDGLAVIGNSSAVERFMASVGLSPDSGAARGAVLNFGAAVAKAGADVAAESGRWVKLTEESAQKVRKFGLMDTKTPGVKHAMIGRPGDIQQWIQIAKSPTALVGNPAALAGGAGIMAQVAMEQSMAEITDYLATIDEKLDAVLRAQTNQVLARMDGVELAVKEAATIRESVGRVSEITWSKLQSSAQTINETQGYAVRQLSDLADKIEEKTKFNELADVVKEAESDVQKWLYVLARCFELHDAVGVLELDRVLDADPDELDRHRIGLKAARQDRLELISGKTEQLLLRMAEAVDTANSKVLLNPVQSPAVVRSSNYVVTEVHEFRQLIGVESAGDSSEARPWKEAAAESWGKVREVGSTGVDAAKHVGGESLGHAKSAGARARETGLGGLASVKQLGSGTRGQARSAKDKLAEKLAGRKASPSSDDSDTTNSHDEPR